MSNKPEAIYAGISQRLYYDPATVLGRNLYANWIENCYNNKDLTAMQADIEQLEHIGKICGIEQHFSLLPAIFTKTTQLKIAFWQIGLTFLHLVFAV